MNGIVDDFRNVFNRRENYLIKIIVINIVVFLIQSIVYVPMYLSGNIGSYNYGLNFFMLPPKPLDLIYQPWSLITCFFMHADIPHILYNMIALYWFGKLIEEYLGSKRLLSLYVLGGLAGSISMYLIYAAFPNLTGNNLYALGASAAVYAIILGASVLLPNYSFMVLFIGPVKIKYIALFFILMAYIGLSGRNVGGDIAHLGGALIGYIFIIQMKKGNDLGAWINNLLDGIQRLFDRKPKMRISHNAKKSKVTVNTNAGSAKNSGSAASAGSPTQDEIDAILDKISEGGYESLTKEEKIKLAKFK